MVRRDPVSDFTYTSMRCSNIVLLELKTVRYFYSKVIKLEGLDILVKVIMKNKTFINSEHFQRESAFLSSIFCTLICG